MSLHIVSKMENLFININFRFVYDQGSFNDQYLLTLSDSVVAGANIFHVSAKDPDSGEFGKIRYELATSNDKKVSELFMIDGTSGKIFTLEGMKQLDQRYTFLFCFNVQYRQEGKKRKLS